MATQLTIVNNVMRRLREDEVTSVADNAYAQLIAMFVNDGIREVCEAYDWSSLIHQIRVDVSDGTSEYDLSQTVAEGGNVNNSDRVTNESSMLRFDKYNRPLAFLYDSSSDTDANIQLKLMTDDDRRYRSLLDTSEANVDPCFFSLPMATTGDGYMIKFWPEPDASRELRIVFWSPQAELAIDGTDDNTEVIVPNRVVEAYAHMIAANERGEEIGEPGGLLERKFANFLGGAIESAMASDMRADRYRAERM